MIGHGAGREEASKDERGIVPVTHHGRFETQFAAVGLQLWDFFDGAREMWCKCISSGNWR